MFHTPIFYVCTRKSSAASNANKNSLWFKLIHVYSEICPLIQWCLLSRICIKVSVPSTIPQHWHSYSCTGGPQATTKCGVIRRSTRDIYKYYYLFLCSPQWSIWVSFETQLEERKRVWWAFQNLENKIWLRHLLLSSSSSYPVLSTSSTEKHWILPPHPSTNLPAPAESPRNAALCTTPLAFCGRSPAAHNISHAALKELVMLEH